MAIYSVHFNHGLEIKVKKKKEGMQEVVAKNRSPDTRACRPGKILIQCIEINQ
jgi:hypothetical protein